MDPLRHQGRQAHEYGYGWASPSWAGAGGRAWRRHLRVLDARAARRARLRGRALERPPAARRTPSPKLAALAIGDPSPPVAEVDPSVLKRYAGVYRVDDETQRTVTLEDGTLRPAHGRRETRGVALRDRILLRGLPDQPRFVATPGPGATGLVFPAAWARRAGGTQHRGAAGGQARGGQSSRWYCRLRGRVRAVRG